MQSTEQVLTPAMVALHTRDREEDYQWYLEIGSSEFFAKLRDLHRRLIADLDARPAAPATFLFLEEGGWIGLLIGNLKTSRSDHLSTRIDDTLLMVFDSAKRTQVYLLAAALLGPLSDGIQQHFLDYAEDLFQQREKFSIPTLRMSLPARGVGCDKLLVHRHVALRANETNCRLVAAMLEHAADNPDELGGSTLIVSTGCAGREKFEQVTSQYDRLIVLSRSSTIPEGDPIPLTSAGKKKPRKLRGIAAAVTLLVCCLLLINWPIVFSKRPVNNLVNTSSDSKIVSNGVNSTTNILESGLAASKIESRSESDSDLRMRVALLAGVAGAGAAPLGRENFAFVVAIATSPLRVEKNLDSSSR